MEFRADGDEQHIEVFTDSDWAGCKETRKSTSGGVVCLGGDVVKSWSKSQGSISLSSGEAEYYSIVKGVSGPRCMQYIALDLGLPLGSEVETDSSAARGICMREGVGKV